VTNSLHKIWQGLSGSQLRKLFWLALLGKLILTALLPLTNDEAYYWVWAQHMQWSYFDHPPAVAWLFWLGHQLFGATSMVRWPAVLLGQVTLAIWLLILRPYCTDQQRFYWLLLAVFSPLIGGTNLLVTPDLPLLFSYALSLWAFFRWRESNQWPRALLFGLCMGLGFSSKYVMVLFPLSLLPLVLLSTELRRALIRHLGWIVLGVLLGAFPVWVWNLQNDFVSIRFQAAHGLGARKWKPSWTMDYILLQVGIAFPVVLYWASRARRKLPLVFHLVAWVPLVFFLCTTWRGYVEANWPIVSYPALFALAVMPTPRNLVGLRFTISLWAFALAALFIIVIGRPEWSKDMKFREFYEFESLLPAVHDLNPLYARSYQMAAKLNFQLQRPIYKLKGMNRKDFYDYLEGSDPHTSRFYLAVEKGDTLPLDYLSRGYRIESVAPVDSRFEVWTVKGP
jgi:4-amino-4-deoxy-L-arabinose transferase-like glycosyltransferase